MQYDSTESTRAHQGAYKGTRRLLRSGQDRWQTHVFRLSDARFANRQNGGADFRIAAWGSDLLVAEVIVRKISGEKR